VVAYDASRDGDYDCWIAPKTGGYTQRRINGTLDSQDSSCYIFGNEMLGADCLYYDGTDSQGQDCAKVDPNINKAWRPHQAQLYTGLSDCSVFSDTECKVAAAPMPLASFNPTGHCMRYLDGRTINSFQCVSQAEVLHYILVADL